MSEPNREAIEAALESFYGKPSTWFGWERNEMSRALTAALPHLLAAKDAEIAALTKQRDEMAISEARYADLTVRDEMVAALREALDLIEPYQDAGGHWCVRCGDSFWTMPAQDEAERIAIVRRAALEMSGGVTPKRDEDKQD